MDIVWFIKDKAKRVWSWWEGVAKRIEADPITLLAPILCLVVGYALLLVWW